jgi:hypothetical protein
VSAAVEALLSAFDALPELDRETVLEAMLLRAKPGVSQFPDDALCELANELFQTYDVTENASPVLIEMP